MSHHLYHTEAIVLKTHNAGESSKTIYLLTRDLGLVHARAQGVRKLGAKLKFGLQDFSHSNITLVRGKEYWKITHSEKIIAHNQIIKIRENHRVAARLASLVLRLVRGEETHPELFTLFRNVYTFIERENLSTAELALVEVAGVLVLLHELGYIETNILPKEFSRGEEWSRALLPLIASVRDQAIIAINQSFEHSHL